VDDDEGVVSTVWKKAVEGTGVFLPPTKIGALAFQIAILLSWVVVVVSALVMVVSALLVVVDGCCWDV